MTHTFAVDFGGTTIKMALRGPGGVLASSSLPNRNDPADLNRVSSVLRGWVDGHGTPLGVGVAVPGVVSPDGLSLRSAHEKYAHLVGLDLTAWAAVTARVPADRCLVENDARCALVGEVAAGTAGDARDVVLVILGTGIGSAALVDGRAVRGAHGFGAILGGHTTVDLDGPACPCGNVGCAEVFGGTWALGARARTHPGHASSPLAAHERPALVDVLGAAATGDRTARDVLDRAVAAWGATVVTLCHCFDPEVVVLSGAPMLAADHLLPALAAHVDAHLWSGMPRPRLVVAPAPQDSVLRGLDHLVRHRSRETQP